MTRNEEKPQIERFKQAAKELGADTDEDTFNEVLRKIAPAEKAGPKEPEK